MPNQSKAIRSALLVARRGRAPGGALSDAINSFSKDREAQFNRPASGSSDQAILAALENEHPQLAVAEPPEQSQAPVSGQVADLGNMVDEGAKWLSGQQDDEAAPVKGQSGTKRSESSSASQPAHPGGPSHSNVDQNSAAMHMMDRLVTLHGWTPAAAAIAAGNAMQESGFQPGVAGDPTVPGGSHGYAQWNRDRFNNLQAFAKQQGTDWTNPDTQIDFLANEAKSRVPNWSSQADLSQARPISKAYEGYGIEGNRVPDANKFFEMYQNRPQPQQAQSGPVSEADPIMTDPNDLQAKRGGAMHREHFDDGGPLSSGQYPARTADTMSDAIAMSSPNGRMSGRSREAVQKQLGEKLFGPGGLQRPGLPTQPSHGDNLRRQIAQFHSNAQRGSPAWQKGQLKQAAIHEKLLADWEARNASQQAARGGRMHFDDGGSGGDGGDGGDGNGDGGSNGFGGSAGWGGAAAAAGYGGVGNSAGAPAGTSTTGTGGFGAGIGGESGFGNANGFGSSVGYGSGAANSGFGGVSTAGVSGSGGGGGGGNAGFGASASGGVGGTGTAGGTAGGGFGGVAYGPGVVGVHNSQYSNFGSGLGFGLGPSGQGDAAANQSQTVQNLRHPNGVTEAQVAQIHNTNPGYGMFGFGGGSSNSTDGVANSPSPVSYTHADSPNTISYAQAVAQLNAALAQRGNPSPAAAPSQNNAVTTPAQIAQIHNTNPGYGNPGTANGPANAPNAISPAQVAQIQRANPSYGQATAPNPAVTHAVAPPHGERSVARGGYLHRASGGSVADIPTDELIALALNRIRKHRDRGGTTADTQSGIGVRQNSNGDYVAVNPNSFRGPSGAGILVPQATYGNQQGNNNNTAPTPPPNPTIPGPAIPSGVVGNHGGSPYGGVPNVGQTNAPVPSYGNTLDEVLGTNNPSMDQIFGFTYPTPPPSKPQPKGPVPQALINNLYGFGGGSQMGTGSQFFQSGGAIIMDAALNKARKAIKGDKANV